VFQHIDADDGIAALGGIWLRRALADIVGDRLPAAAGVVPGQASGAGRAPGAAAAGTAVGMRGKSPEWASVASVAQALELWMKESATPATDRPRARIAAGTTGAEVTPLPSAATRKM
jgi:hypothetical protein